MTSLIEWWQVATKGQPTAHAFTPSGSTACGHPRDRRCRSNGSERRCRQCASAVRRAEVSVLARRGPANDQTDETSRLADSILVAELEGQARWERVVARDHAEAGRHQEAIASLSTAARHERDAEEIRRKWGRR